MVIRCFLEGDGTEVFFSPGGKVSPGYNRSVGDIFSESYKVSPQEVYWEIDFGMSVGRFYTTTPGWRRVSPQTFGPDALCLYLSGFVCACVSASVWVCMYVWLCLFVCMSKKWCPAI